MRFGKLVIAVGTGFLGEVLINNFHTYFNEIIVLSRSVKNQNKLATYIQWDGETLTGWEGHLEGADVLINLAGKSVDCRYTEKNKALILNSRINSTKVLNKAVAQCEVPPKHFIQPSTATIYQHSVEVLNTEENGVIGDDFSMNIAKAWEKEFTAVAKPNTICTILRTSIVLGKNGGALIPLKNIVKKGLGGKQGNGQQKVSRIHETDFANSILFCIQNKIEGVLNVVAPNTVNNSDFMKSLRQTLKIPLGLPASKLLLQIGAFFLRTEPELVLKSRNVYPEKLINAGFKFTYPKLNNAFNDLV